jgi:protein-disulfide isomerase
MSRVRAKTRGIESTSAAREKESARSRSFLLIGLLVALIVGIILLAALARRGGAGPQLAEHYEGLTTERNFLGEPDAPLLIRNFSDFKCPHCRTAARDLLPPVIENYIAEGRVRFEYVPVAVLGQESEVAAQGALCAADQGQFWQYHDVLFANQSSMHTIQSLTTYADQLGLDSREFRGCVTSGKYRTQVQENMAAFRQTGGTGTPTFLVGDTVVGGAVPFSDMQPVIEAELAEG